MQPREFIWWITGILGEEIYKFLQCCVAMKIRWKFHCQVVATNVLTLPLEVEEKEELKHMLKCGELSFYVMVDSEVLTYLEKMK